MYDFMKRRHKTGSPKTYDAGMIGKTLRDEYYPIPEEAKRPENPDGEDYDKNDDRDSKRDYKFEPHYEGENKDTEDHQSATTEDQREIKEPQ
jgi:hypothetical protein